MAPTLLKPWSYFPLGLRAYRDTFRFTGRARRLEAWEFYIVSAFLVLAIKLLADVVPEIRTSDPRADFLTNTLVADAIQVIVTLPVFALVARRIQDFGLPGWAFSPLMLYVVAMNEWKTVAIFTEFEAPSWLFQLPAIAIVVAMLIALFIAGDTGPNHYGPDPVRPD